MVRLTSKFTTLAVPPAKKFTIELSPSWPRPGASRAKRRSDWIATSKHVRAPASRSRLRLQDLACTAEVSKLARRSHVRHVSKPIRHGRHLVVAGRTHPPDRICDGSRQTRKRSCGSKGKTCWRWKRRTSLRENPWRGEIEQDRGDDPNRNRRPKRSTRRAGFMRMATKRKCDGGSIGSVERSAFPRGSRS